MTQGFYDFWLKDLADFYIEAIKSVTKGTDAEATKAALNTLYICLDQALKLLHPTMPYLTEELYQRLPHRKGTASESIVIAEYPVPGVTFDGTEDQVNALRKVIGAFRSQMANINVPKSASPAIYIKCQDAALGKVFKEESNVFKTLLRCGDVNVLGASDADPAQCLKDFISEEFTIYIQVVGIIDISLELKRIQKQLDQQTKLRDDLNKKINMPGYADKVPQKVRDENDKKVAQYNAVITSSNEAIENWKKFV